MKNALFTFALLFVVALSANGQSSSDELQELATEKTRLLMQQYQLNESDYLRLKALNLNYLTHTAEFRQRFSNDRSLLEAKVKAEKNAYELQLRELISPAQYARFQQKSQVIAQATRKQ